MEEQKKVLQQGLNYLKAKAAFKNCYTRKGNEYLIDELGLPYDLLLLMEDSWCASRTKVFPSREIT